MALVGGRYETVERIGGGGMADVFRAHDRTLDRDVALKVMRPAFARDPEFAERFHREAEALGAIEHPNVVRVLDYGASADGPFIVMELVSGGTLRGLMRACGRIDQYAAARIAAGIADGLEAAHLRGVLHRDLKPDNILLDGEGRPKIADFGIARLAAAAAITRTGEVLGTPQYLAPEQMTADVVDERADVYALGVILYEMLTGTQPTGGTTPSEIASRRLRIDPRAPAKLVALAPALNALVLQALARDPGRRTRRAADLRAALRAIQPQAPRASRARAVVFRRPSTARFLAFFALIAGFIRVMADRVRRAAHLRVASPAIRLPAPPPLPAVTFHAPSPGPLMAALAVLSASIRRSGREIARRAALRTAGPTPSSATSRVRVVRARRRLPAPLAPAFALLVALIGGSLVFAKGQPAVAPASVAIATPAPTVAILASTSSPAPTAQPERSSEPTPEPTAEPTIAPTQAPVIAVAAAGDPAGTIVAFYQLISGHDYDSASNLWSDRMRASYPPQTNIWGRFDATKSIVARAASVSSANPSSAAVAVDLIETRTDGSLRHWVGTWYLVRYGAGWLMDQPGLRAA